MNDFEIEQINNELNKSFIYKMKNSNIDYLIIDFYGDLFFGIVKDVFGGYLTNKKWLFTRNNIFNQVTEEGQTLSFEKILRNTLNYGQNQWINFLIII